MYNIIELLAKRLTDKRAKLDATIIFDGYEGYGKTTMSLVWGYIMSKLTGRSFNVNNVFFDLDEMIEFAVNSKEQIILWDEAALGGLSSEWNTELQKRLLKLLMVGRKKRHFFMFNIPQVFRLQQYIIDRALGLVHIYARNETELGRFVYYRRNNLNFLYDRWKTSKKKEYRKHWSFRGTFPNALSKVIDEEAYDKKKDKAIMSIAKAKERKLSKYEINKLRALKNLGKLDRYTKKELALLLETTPRTLGRWIDKDIPQEAMAYGGQKQIGTTPTDFFNDVAPNKVVHNNSQNKTAFKER